jgi:small GTP-binding protein
VRRSPWAPLLPKEERPGSHAMGTVLFTPASCQEDTKIFHRLCVVFAWFLVLDICQSEEKNPNPSTRMVDGVMRISLLTIGDSHVGKSSLLLRFTATNPAKFELSPTMTSTIGIDFRMKNLDIGEKRIKVQIVTFDSVDVGTDVVLFVDACFQWDTAGQERFRDIAHSYYRRVHGIMLVYDVTDEKSFTSIRTWMSQIDMHADDNVSKILIANKLDLERDKETPRVREFQACNRDMLLALLYYMHVGCHYRRWRIAGKRIWHSLL